MRVYRGGRSRASELRGIIDQLCEPLDPARHGQALSTLRSVRRADELDQLAGAWLTDGPGARLKLIKHGAGTFMVVEYDDGWTTRLSMAALRRR